MLKGLCCSELEVGIAAAGSPSVLQGAGSAKPKQDRCHHANHGGHQQQPPRTVTPAQGSHAPSRAQCSHCSQQRAAKPTARAPIYLHPSKRGRCHSEAKLSTEPRRDGLGWKSLPRLSPGSWAPEKLQHYQQEGVRAPPSSPCFRGRDGKPRDEGKCLVPSDAQRGKTHSPKGLRRSVTAPARHKGN